MLQIQRCTVQNWKDDKYGFLIQVLTHDMLVSIWFIMTHSFLINNVMWRQKKTWTWLPHGRESCPWETWT
jgi:hypothetical protein